MSRFLKIQLQAFCLLTDASSSTHLLPLSAFESPGPISSPGLFSGLWNHGTKCLSSPFSWIPKALNSVSKTSHHLPLIAWSSYSVLCPVNASTIPLITKTQSQEYKFIFTFNSNLSPCLFYLISF